MAKKRPALGKGIGALISDAVEDKIDKNARSLNMIDVDQIVPNALQPRKQFDEESLAALAQSIAENGILQPLILRKDDQHYEIIAGERRWRAARQAKLSQVPAIIMDPSEQKIYEIALIENMQRENLNPIEEALAYQALIRQFDMTQRDVSHTVGKSRSYIANVLRLLTLTDHVKTALADGLISAGHGKVLVNQDADKQQQYCRKVIDEQLSVRQLEALLRKQGRTNRHTSATGDQDDAYYRDYLKQLEDIIGSKVAVSSRAKHKQIVIDFYDDADFERIYHIISGNVSRETTQ